MGASFNKWIDGETLMGDVAEELGGSLSGVVAGDASKTGALIEEVEVEIIPRRKAADPLLAVLSEQRRFRSDDDRLRACETAIGYIFFDKSLLRNALTHSSSVQNRGPDNERLEFFGDAILDLVIREYLFHHYPEQNEGELTEAKSAVVCRDALVRAAKRADLRPFIFLGRGMNRRQPVPESLLADAFEAVVAAIYLDGGIPAARDFILAYLGADIPLALEKSVSVNHKSSLQKTLQQKRRPLPAYRLLAATGPEHSRTFQVAVLVEGRELGRGIGQNKKAAEQAAACVALANLERESEAGERKAT
ncbi:MAG: ribonuclease III [Planctomycetota bacterium]|jgi:ribonuclease-3|nr:ribonuclease III [Planctomycetota bacterium]